MRIAVVAFVVFVLAAAGYLIWQQQIEPPFQVSGFIEADEIRVGSQVGGRVADVLIDEGARVSTGDLLFRLEPYDLTQTLARAEADLAAKRAMFERLSSGFREEDIEQARAMRDARQATLDRLIAGPREQELEIARARRAKAQAALDFAITEYKRIEKLRERQQAASIEFQSAEKARDVAQADVNEAQQQLALLEAGTRKEDLAEARASLAEAAAVLNLRTAGYRKEEIAEASAAMDAASAQVESIRVRVAELEVRSPCDCIVSAIDLRPGDLVGPNMPSAALLDVSRLWVRAYVPEGRLGEIKLDQEVPVRVDTWPDRRFTGRLSFLATDAEFTPKNIQTPEERSKLVYRVKVMIQKGLDDLRVGMAADVMFGEAGRP